MSKSKLLSTGMLVFALFLTTILPSMASSTAKSLSTNFTLVNLGDTAASGLISYFTESGTAWKADETFSIATAGGQAIYRQYFDDALTSGRGSVVVNSSQPLGAVVQILARNQTPTSGAYIGASQGAQTQYVPLVIRRRVGASGLTNSQITIQNTGSGSTSVSIQLVNNDGTNGYLKSVPTLAAGASYFYDLDDEIESNVAAGWFGSAVVSAGTGGALTVVSSLYTGANGMQTFNAFSTPANNWLVPLFTSRLSNGLSTPIAIQNLSGGQLAANAITVTCTRNPNSTTEPATLTIRNADPIGNTASFNINPVTNSPATPDNWYGSCTISSTGGVVAFVQMRTIGTDKAAAYEAIPAGGTDKQVVIPLASKRLANGFASVTNVQNMSASAEAHVNFTYIPSTDYVNAGGSSQNVVINNVTIPVGGSIQHNLRLTGSNAPAVPQLPDGWYGSCVIQSTDQAINAIVELTFLTGDGDTYQAHNAFTKP